MPDDVNAKPFYVLSCKELNYSYFTNDQASTGNSVDNISRELFVYVYDLIDNVLVLDIKSPIDKMQEVIKNVNESLVYEDKIMIQNNEFTEKPNYKNDLFIIKYENKNQIKTMGYSLINMAKEKASGSDKVNQTIRPKRLNSFRDSKYIFVDKDISYFKAIDPADQDRINNATDLKEFASKKWGWKNIIILHLSKDIIEQVSEISTSKHYIIQEKPSDLRGFSDIVFINRTTGSKFFLKMKAKDVTDICNKLSISRDYIKSMNTTRYSVKFCDVDVRFEDQILNSISLVSYS
ncbi:hypothetical protein TVAG_336110 [Trichomonas vaginalis G3]|uniref:Uncharacterized protein n=1 Tax=Trichomonas vaginalis (strain ATCC PRA-98 / G3) TaxID=412133 RepID=A2FN97_TRIV3|nr:hypothetical protein TVAGG3_0795520 [Trichomonas vaginalis G3]EAX93625.1 hypothetical protein TVAG_336110 [Trichomonas vaginalis G3]KAI5496138.1 hypothetical protein TVAGG3_0795520 [Trichomonas vaginalis G3]|eukprot:XP_001306555.1 hypothetical protein [Trichomonas vaginalis G3]